VPLNESTRHAIGEAELRRMKPTAILINTARGPVVDEAALAKALSEHWIAAAGLDVFEREPEVHPALLACSNAVFAPHIGSASNATRRKMTMMAAEMHCGVDGKTPANLLNPAVWDSWASRPEAQDKQVGGLEGMDGNVVRVLFLIDHVAADDLAQMLHRHASSSAASTSVYCDLPGRVMSIAVNSIVGSARGGPIGQSA